VAVGDNPYLELLVIMCERVDFHIGYYLEEFLAERRSPLTPARGRGYDCGKKVERSWRIELAAGQVLRATHCSAYGFGGGAAPG